MSTQIRIPGLTDRKLTLYFDEVNPQSRSCVVLIKFLSLDVELIPVDLSTGDQLCEEYASLNPAHTVPILVNDNFILTDSHTILMYLCDLCRDVRRHKLYPTCFTLRLQVINKLFFESNILSRRHNELMTDIVRKSFPKIDYQYHLKKVVDAYNTLEDFLGTSSYFIGDRTSIVDISFFTTLSGLNLVFPITYVRWPRLCYWYQGMCASPFGTFNECGVQKQCSILERFGNFVPGMVGRQSETSVDAPVIRTMGINTDPSDIDASFIATKAAAQEETLRLSQMQSLKIEGMAMKLSENQWPNSNGQIQACGKTYVDSPCGIPSCTGNPRLNSIMEMNKKLWNEVQGRPRPQCSSRPSYKDEPCYMPCCAKPKLSCINERSCTLRDQTRQLQMPGCSTQAQPKRGLCSISFGGRTLKDENGSCCDQSQQTPMADCSSELQDSCAMPFGVNKQKQENFMQRIYESRKCFSDKCVETDPSVNDSGKAMSDSEQGKEDTELNPALAELAKLQQSKSKVFVVHEREGSIAIHELTDSLNDGTFDDDEYEANEVDDGSEMTPNENADAEEDPTLLELAKLQKSTSRKYIKHERPGSIAVHELTTAVARSENMGNEQENANDQGEEAEDPDLIELAKLQRSNSKKYIKQERAGSIAVHELIKPKATEKESEREQETAHYEEEENPDLIELARLQRSNAKKYIKHERAGSIAVHELTTPDARKIADIDMRKNDSNGGNENSTSQNRRSSGKQ